LHRAYKYRLYPTEEQAAQLNQSFAAVRWVYNAALEQRNMYGRSKKDGPDYWGRPTNFNAIGQRKEIHYKIRENYCGLLNDDELAWITETPFDCLVVALRDLEQAFKRFFDGIKKGTGEGYPSFRSADRNNSISFRAWDRKKINGISVTRPKSNIWPRLCDAAQTRAFKIQAASQVLWRSKDC